MSTALVTGAGQGMGATIAARLAADDVPLRMPDTTGNVANLAEFRGHVPTELFGAPALLPLGPAMPPYCFTVGRSSRLPVRILCA